jgi:nucleoside-diphosphate-sugar epimerase
MDNTQTVLVTGMSGLIGGAVRRQLGDQYNLRALNRRDVPGVETVQADISDLDAVEPAFRGVDTVVHLAALVELNPPIEDLSRVNLVGTYNVFEAARRAGVRRVVYASSGATVSGYERKEPYKALVEGRYADVPEEWPMITHEWPVDPRGTYGVSKVWGEALARQFVSSDDISILCLRIGMVTEEDKPLSSRDYSVWCSQRDIAHMVELCIKAPSEVDFDILFVTSRNKWSYRDIDHARQSVGYVPQDAAEDHR